MGTVGARPRNFAGNLKTRKVDLRAEHVWKCSSNQQQGLKQKATLLLVPKSHVRFCRMKIKCPSFHHTITHPS